jgi:hypothetical protein
MVKTNFQEFSFIADKKIAVIIWQENTKYMKDEDYKTEQINTLNFVLDNKASKLLINTQQLNFAITPDLQIWTDLNLVQPLINAGVEKFAFIIPSDLFTQVSVEQAVEENAQQLQSSRFFESKEEALNWLG